MELDDLKLAWKALDRRLERSERLSTELLRERRLDALRRRLRPLFWGQVLQMLAGVVLLLLAVSVWSDHREGGALFVAGVAMHAYAIAMIVFGGLVHGRLARLDHAAPVLELQTRLAKLRRLYVFGSAALGLAWWVLWIPFAMIAFDAAFGVDVYRYAPGAIHLMLAVGVLGLGVTPWLHRWAMRRAALARRLEASAAGGSFNRAREALDEIARFEALD